MPVLFSFQQVREDLATHTRGLSDEQIWAQTPGGTLGFHLKHLAGSVDRISTYLIGGTLTEAQLQQLSFESDGQGGLGELLARIDGSLAKGRRTDPRGRPGSTVRVSRRRP